MTVSAPPPAEPVVTDDLLLEATGVSKTYGAVVAIATRPSRFARGGSRAHGPERRGKSTFVKILTGAVVPDSGRVVIRGRERSVHSPAEARERPHFRLPGTGRHPGSDHRRQLALTSTPIEPFRHWLGELGLIDLDLGSLARRLPLASLRIIDLARALAIEPDILLLDEMTAALPADLTERVLEVIVGGERR